MKRELSLYEQLFDILSTRNGLGESLYLEGGNSHIDIKISLHKEKMHFFKIDTKIRYCVSLTPQSLL